MTDGADMKTESEGDMERVAALKAGWRTTEFWIALGMKLIGVYLISKGQDELGSAIVLAGGGGYMLGRTSVKKAARVVSALLVVCLLALPGCACDRHLDVDNVGPLIEKVCTRHDAYVSVDPSLSPEERSTALRSSQILMLDVEEARKAPEATDASE